MHSEKNRDFLISALKETLIPHMESMGFHPSVVKKNKPSKEMKIAFPFANYERDGNESIQVIEVQFEKSGGASFVINFGKVSPEGISLPWGHFPADEVSVASLPESYRLMKFPKFQRWFSFGLFVLDREKAAGRLASDVVAHFSEVENWFGNGTIGEHMCRLGYPHSSS